MEILKVEGLHGPLNHLVTSVWRDDEETYHIILDDPKRCRWIVITLDVRPIIRQAVLVN